MLFSLLFLISSFNPNQLLLNRLDQDVYEDYYSKTVFVTVGCSDIGQLEAVLINPRVLRFKDSDNDCVVVKINPHDH